MIRTSTAKMRAETRPRLRTSRLGVATLAVMAASVVWGPPAMAQTSPAITSSPPQVGLVGNGYVHLFQVSPSGGGAVFLVTAGSLPPGITLGSGGFLTGVPSSAGSFGPTTVCAANGVAPPPCQTFTITVHQRRPAILASASPGGALGTQVRDTASLVGGVLPTGSVTFRLFGDPACTVEVFRSTNAVSNGAATSNDFTPTGAGTYMWTTSYTGDANHEPASTPCSSSNSVTITTSSPSTTVPPPSTTTSTSTTTSLPMTSQRGLYHALPPARILDTRHGAPIGPGGTIVQTVSGAGGVPATGVSAVVLNVTVTQPTEASFLTVYANGTRRPPTANLNFVAGQTVQNLVVADVGADGRVAVYNQGGSVHVVFDVAGWFGTDGAAAGGSRYHALPLARILDTRNGAPVAGGGTIVQDVTGVGGVPATGVSAVVLELSVTQPTAPSFLTMFPSGAALPLAANLNFVAAQTVTNLVVAKVGADGKVALYNHAGSAHVVVDVVGWFGADGADGATLTGGRYSALAPARILDTRNGAPVAGTIVQGLTGLGGVPATGVSAVVVNVTVTQPTAPSFLTIHANGTARPLAANMTFAANQTVTNLVVATVGADGKVAIYNHGGSTHLVLDVVGWYSA